MLCVPRRAGGFVCTLLGLPGRVGCGSDATAGFRPPGTARTRPHSVTAVSCCSSAPLKLIMKIGPLPDALKPDIHCVRTQWIRGFMAFHLVRRTRTVLLMVPV